LFEPPASFHRVIRFPDTDRDTFTDDIQRYWEWFQDYLAGFFS
jgi:hypothetical protein